MSRETLEQEALQAVCSCWYYDLADQLDSTPDETLQAIINNSMYLHFGNQLYSPVSPKEFTDEIMSCAKVELKIEQEIQS